MHQPVPLLECASSGDHCSLRLLAQPGGHDRASDLRQQHSSGRKSRRSQGGLYLCSLPQSPRAAKCGGSHLPGTNSVLARKPPAMTQIKAGCCLGTKELASQAGQASVFLLLILGTFLLASVGFAVDLSNM